MVGEWGFLGNQGGQTIMLMATLISRGIQGNQECHGNSPPTPDGTLLLLAKPQSHATQQLDQWSSCPGALGQFHTAFKQTEGEGNISGQCPQAILAGRSPAISGGIKKACWRGVCAQKSQGTVTGMWRSSSRKAERERGTQG